MWPGRHGFSLFGAGGCPIKKCGNTRFLNGWVENKLASIPASNGDVERFFGRLNELWTDPQRQSNNGEHCMLACNGPQLAMAGYNWLPQKVVPEAATQEEPDAQGEVFE